MPKFGVDVTKMSDVSGAGVFGSNVRQGVEDRSGAMRTAATTGLIGAAGSMGVAAYEGYQLADIEAEQEKNVSDYMQSKNNPAIAEQAQIDAASLRSATDSLWNNFDTTIEDVNPIERNFQDKLKTYERAAREGVMTPDELSSRILATTREAVNRNPGMYDKLLQHSKKTLELSGIQEISKQDERKQVSAIDALKDMQARARAVGYSYTATTPYSELESNVVELERDNLSLKQAKAARERHDLVTTADAEAFERTRGDAVQKAQLSSFKVGALTLFKDNNTDSYKNVAFALRDFATSSKEEFASIIPPQIRDTPASKARIERYNKHIDDTIASMEKLGSGEDARKVLENSVAVYESSEKAGMHKRYNVTATRMAMDIVRSAPDIIVKDSNIRTKLMEVTSDMLSGNLSSPAVEGMIPRNIEDKNMAIPIASQAKLSLESKDWTGLNKVLSAYNSKTASITDPKQKQIYLYNNIEALSKQDLTGLDAATYGQVNNMIGSYLKDPQFGLPSMFNNLKDTNVILDVLPDGKLLFTGEGADKYNAGYANKINTSLQAYAKAQGVSIKEAAGNFYPEYFGSALKDSDIGKPVSPKSITPPMRKGEVSGKILQEEIRIPVATQKARDDKVLQMLYQELADQQTQGKVDPELIKDISFREKRMGIK